MKSRHLKELLVPALCFQLYACQSAAQSVAPAAAAEVPSSTAIATDDRDDDVSIATGARAYAQSLGAIRTAFHEERSEPTESTESVSAMAAAAPFLHEYFTTLIAEAEELQDESVSTNEALVGLERFRDRRADLTDALFEAVDAIEPLDDVFRYQGFEIDVYNDNLRSFLEDEYIQNLVLRTALLDRKYFHGEDDGGNFLEGWINGKLAFTQFDDESDAWFRDDGVSHFEATVRIEPTVSLQDNNEAAVLLTAGMLYHMFPDVTANGFEPVEDDGFFSKYVRRIGFRVGVGAMESSGVIAGGGLQVRAVTVWMVRDFDEDEWIAMIGLSDLTFLRGYLPFFGD